jgi:hypothetical protein
MSICTVKYRKNSDDRERERKRERENRVKINKRLKER